MSVDRRRAWVSMPTDQDAYDVFVVRDVHGGRSSLLCGDGEWREYDACQSLTEAPFSPTRRVPAREVLDAWADEQVWQVFTEGLPADVVPLVERAVGMPAVRARLGGVR